MFYIIMNMAPSFGPAVIWKLTGYFQTDFIKVPVQLFWQWKWLNQAMTYAAAITLSSVAIRPQILSCDNSLPRVSDVQTLLNYYSITYAWRITGPLWGETIGGWIHLKQDQ